jgi:hypothetical protein
MRSCVFFAAKGIQASAGVRINTKERGFLLLKVIKAENKYRMFQDIRGVPRMKPMTVTKHGIMI